MIFFQRSLTLFIKKGPGNPCPKFHNCVTQPSMDSKRHSNNDCARSNSMIASSRASICEPRSMPPVQRLCCHSSQNFRQPTTPATLPFFQPLSSCKKRPAARNNSTALDMPASPRKPCSIGRSSRARHHYQTRGSRHHINVSKALEPK